MKDINQLGKSVKRRSRTGIARAPNLFDIALEFVWILNEGFNLATLARAYPLFALLEYSGSLFYIRHCSSDARFVFLPFFSTGQFKSFNVNSCCARVRACRKV